MRRDPKPMPRCKRFAAAEIGVAESSFEDDLAFVGNGDDAAGLLGLAHLKLDPLRDVIESRVQPAVHRVRSPWGRPRVCGAVARVLPGGQSTMDTVAPPQ